jgi:hypothetical protein
MKLFGKTKMQKFESVVATLKTRGALLSTKRVTAQAAFDSAITARQEMLISGDIDDQKLALKLQSAVDSAASTLGGIDDAISALRVQIESAEQQLAAERQRVERLAASEQIASDVAAVERQIEPWLRTTRDLAASMAALDHVFEVGQIGHYLSNGASEVEVAVAVTLPQLHALVTAVANGDAPIPHRPEPVVPVAEVPAAPTQIVFCLRSVKWRDENGVQCVAGKFTDAYLPPETVVRALRSGACVEISDPLRKQHHGWSTEHPRANLAFDLDADPAMQASTPVAPELHSTFQPVDRGPAFTLRVAK